MKMQSNGLDTSIWAARGPSYHFNHNDYRAPSAPRISRSSTPSNAAVKPTPTAADLPPSNPPAAAPAISSSAVLTPAQAFHRFEQACQRLRWKYIDLETSYKRAMSPGEWNFSPQDAERNFKVDFHEFYVWIEQALVLALLVFGVVVPRGDVASSSSRDGGGGGGRGPRSMAAHTYHHNVLKVLDEAGNPLHEPLGRGDVNHALWKAKELRNRWKDAAEGRETPPLKMYDLTWIVTQVLGGLEVAYGMAAARVEEARVSDSAGAGPVEIEVEVDGWDWMVEQMDWEA